MSRDKALTYEVFVRNLPYSVTEDDLKSMFSECGNVVRVSIAPATRFAMPHLSQNTYGFVGFTNETIVQKAVSWFNGKKVHGQCITVEESYMTRHLKTGSSPSIVEKSVKRDPRNRSEVTERMRYIHKCYDDVVQLKPELKLPAWLDFEKTIWRQTYSLAVPCKFPVQDVDVDLSEIDRLVQSVSVSSSTSSRTNS